MNHQDRQAIEELFGKLARSSGRPEPRTPRRRNSSARRSRGSRCALLHGADHRGAGAGAECAQGRIEQLEDELASRPAGGVASCRACSAGGQTRPRRTALSAAPMQRHVAAHGGGLGTPVMGGMASRRGGGFLAGAAQTAMGVAGGMMLGNLIANAFSGGDEAKTADAGQAEPQQAAAEDFGDAGGDFGFEEDI